MDVLTEQKRTELVWVRTPVQARSQATLSRLLDATETLLDKEPFDDLSVQAICKEAKSSVGAFYTRFPDKLALLHLLHDRLTEEARATANLALDPVRWEGIALGEIVKTMATFMVTEYTRRGGLRRELVRRNGVDGEFRRRTVEIATLTVDRLANVLDLRRLEHAHSDTRVAADFSYRILFSVLDQAAQLGEHGPAGIVLPQDTMVTELTRAICAYLSVKLPG